MAGVWAGLVRVSHMGARKSDAADFHSERDQREAIRAEVNKRGGTLKILPSELDVSGGLPLAQRPSLLEAVEGIEAGRYCGIVLAYHSRLGRDVEVEEAVWRRVEAAGGQIIMALDGLDTTTVDGKMVRRIRSAMNAAERERHVERFDDLRRWATAAGVWQRRQVPLGYSKAPDTRQLMPNQRAEDVCWAFRARAAGTPISGIADRLGMTPSGVRQLLKNRVYVGELRVGAHVNPTAHPPLVDLDTFDAAQLSVPRPSRKRGAPALLAGLARCASCGHLLTRGGSREVPVYTCSVRHSGARCPAPAAVTIALLDAHVECIALAELGRLSVTARQGDGLERARQAVKAAERELAAYLAAISAADVGVEVFAAGARKRREHVDRVREELQLELGRRPLLPAVENGAEAWGMLDGHEHNALLRALLSAVVVARSGGRGSRTTLASRVRVLAHGAPLKVPERRGGEASGVVPIPLADIDDPYVLGLPSREDGL